LAVKKKKNSSSCVVGHGL